MRIADMRIGILDMLISGFWMHKKVDTRAALGEASGRPGSPRMAKGAPRGDS